jgi:hypothetical protein
MVAIFVKIALGIEPRDALSPSPGYQSHGKPGRYPRTAFPLVHPGMRGEGRGEGHCGSPSRVRPFAFCRQIR